MGKILAWMKTSKIKLALILLFFILLMWFITRETQENLPYSVSGSEILIVKEKCKNLAELKELEWNEMSSVDINLVRHGYSEFRGFCYAEYIRYFDDWGSKILYNTTEEREIVSREYPDDLDWYQRGFDWFVLGKKKFYQTTF